MATHPNPFKFNRPHHTHSEAAHEYLGTQIVPFSYSRNPISGTPVPQAPYNRTQMVTTPHSEAASKYLGTQISKSPRNKY
jgi:hypothetical protein